MTEAQARPPRTPLLQKVAPLLVAILFFATIAPTLTWVEFSNGSENLNVATVLDTKRDGRWLVPRLQGERRTQKPPLTAWLTGAAVRESSFDGMSSRDPAVRERSARQLAWDVRWTALASMGALVMAAYALGRTIADERVGLIAALVCGSSLLFLRHARMSTTDVQLALWVTIANLGLAKAVVQQKWWTGLTLAGVALGLALMSKGPVAFLQTVTPVLAFVAWRAWTMREETASSPRRRVAGPIALFVLLTLAIGFSWFAHVLLSSGSTSALWARWMTEVTREGATDLPASPWYNYALIVPHMFPWVVFLVVGLVLSAQAIARRSADPIFLSAFLLVVPLVLMSFFRDREDRYLLPMVGPAALVTAWGLREHMRSWATWTRADATAVTIHWLALAVVAIGLPLAGAMNLQGMRTIDGGPWYTWGFAAMAASIAAVIIVVGVMLHRRYSAGLIAPTVAVMLLLQFVVVHGYRDTSNGRSDFKPLAEAIWRDVPDAVVHSGVQGRRTPTDLSIYLNREIVTVTDPAAITRTDRPQVLLLYQRKRTPEPVPPPGWTYLAKADRDGSYWWAYVMLARAVTTQWSS